MRKFAAKLTDKQVQLARAFEHAGLTSYSQAVKVFERNDNTQIEEWKKRLTEKGKAHD
jgi:hypothetical protein